MLYASLKLRTPYETDALLTQLRGEEVVTYTELVTAPGGGKAGCNPHGPSLCPLLQTAAQPDSPSLQLCTDGDGPGMRASEITGSLIFSPRLFST